MKLNKGDVLKVVVGHAGMSGSNTMSTAYYGGGGGGGGTFVVNNAKPLMVAGGGGGGTAYAEYKFASTTTKRVYEAFPGMVCSLAPCPRASPDSSTCTPGRAPVMRVNTLRALRMRRAHNTMQKDQQPNSNPRTLPHHSHCVRMALRMQA